MKNPAISMNYISIYEGRKSQRRNSGVLMETRFLRAHHRLPVLLLKACFHLNGHANTDVNEHRASFIRESVGSIQSIKS